MLSISSQCLEHLQDRKEQDFERAGCSFEWQWTDQMAFGVLGGGRTVMEQEVWLEKSEVQILSWSSSIHWHRPSPFHQQPLCNGIWARWNINILQSQTGCQKLAINVFWALKHEQQLSEFTSLDSSKWFSTVNKNHSASLRLWSMFPLSFDCHKYLAS